jgi:hypothetical protein
MWSTHSRWIVPINRSANEFCHGEPAEIGLSRMPIARNRRVTATLFDAVQAKLNAQRNNHTAARAQSGSLLIGRISMTTMATG